MIERSARDARSDNRQSGVTIDVHRPDATNVDDNTVAYGPARHAATRSARNDREVRIARPANNCRDVFAGHWNGYRPRDYTTNSCRLGIDRSGGEIVADETRR
jgi:hypothetical protein